MKPLKIIISALLCGTVLLSCSNLDLSPQDEASTGNWFQTVEQFDMNLNALLLHQFWPQERNEWTSGNQCELDALTDDFTNRTTMITFTNGNLNGTNPVVTQMWNVTYTGINRCNKIITELKKAGEEKLGKDSYDRIMGNALFYRACFYSRLLMHFGDVVVVDEDIDIDTEAGRDAAYLLERQDRWSVLEDVLADFDQAKLLLPVQYSGSEVQRATQGAALGMKARTALYFASVRKWDKSGLANAGEAERLFGVAAEAAKSCMDLNVYTLHQDFGNLFLQSTKNSPEGIFVIPRSKILSNNSKYQYLNGQSCTAKLSRLSGASSCTTVCPSWDLLCCFLCTDGLPIDESPLYDPHEPFKNRDPRCAYTIVEFGTKHLGVEYNPHFEKTTVYSDREGKDVTNNDSRSYLIEGTSNAYASYNGLVLKKGIDNDWLSPFEVEPDKKILRYADILLMYAEAKIEMNDIDQSVLDAINDVRSRAYGVDRSSDAYPAVTTTDQTELRTIIRTERRMEFAFENLRYLDLYRWRIAGKVMNFYNYGLPKKDETLQRSYLDNGMWFHGAVPQIDENGCPDFTVPPAKGESTFFTNYAITLGKRVFDESKHYLWPVPTTTLEVMPNIEPNPGY